MFVSHRGAVLGVLTQLLVSSVGAQPPRIAVIVGGGALLPLRSIGTFNSAEARLSGAPAFQFGVDVSAPSDRFGGQIDALLAPGTSLEIRPTRDCRTPGCAPLSNPRIRLSVVTASLWARPVASVPIRLQVGVGFVARGKSDDVCTCEPVSDRYYLDAGRFAQRHSARGARFAASWAPSSRVPLEITVADLMAGAEAKRLQHYFTVLANLRWRIRFRE